MKILKELLSRLHHGNYQLYQVKLTDKSLYILLASALLFVWGCQPCKESDVVNEALCEDSIVVQFNTDSTESHIVSQTFTHVDSLISQSVAIDSLPYSYEDFVKLEVNKEKGYEVRRVNELVFANNMVVDTLLAALLDMSPLTRNQKITMYVIPVSGTGNGICLEKSSHAPKTVPEGGEEYLYHFGYMQIDTFFLDIVGFKGKDKYGDKVNDTAKGLFKQTGVTKDIEYKYYLPYPEDDKYYNFVITDSTIIMTEKYSWTESDDFH